MDDNPIAQGGLWVPGALQTASIQPLTEIFDFSPGMKHPLVLAQNEGFVVKNDNNLGAASGIVMYFLVDWTEAQVF